MLIRGAVSESAPFSRWTDALVACNEYNKQSGYGRAMVQIDEEKHEVSIYYDAALILPCGVTDEVLHCFIDQCFTDLDRFFIMGHREGLY